MEPNLIDYYNEIPHGINVIDKMNEELSDLQKKYEKLKEKYTLYVRTHQEETFNSPKIRVDTLKNLKIYAKKIFNSIPQFTKIIYDFLNHEGWILDYDKPDRAGTSTMGYADCGYWDTWEHDKLKWGDTSAQEFYYGELCVTNYSIYLRCKLLDELYKLFPEYKFRGRGWFHSRIDECFETIETTVIIMLSCQHEFINPTEIHDIIYKLIMERLFGWGSDRGEFGIEGFEGVFPYEYMNEEYVQNIIYYKCDKCKKVFHGEDAMDYDEQDEDISWFYEDGNLCAEVCKCNN